MTPVTVVHNHVSALHSDSAILTPLLTAAQRSKNKEEKG
jgi:hypothetical protein